MTRPGISESERGNQRSQSGLGIQIYPYTTPRVRPVKCFRKYLSGQHLLEQIKTLFANQQQSRDGLVGIKMGDNDYYVAKYP